MSGRMGINFLESILVKALKCIAWFLEHFLIADRSKDDDYHQHQQSSSENSNTEAGNDPHAPGNTTMEAALKFFDLDADEITRETVRQKYKRLSLLYHPDRNGQTPDSVEKMQLVNLHYDTLTRELDQREGSVERENMDDEEDSDPSEQESGPISTEERNRRKKAQQEVNRQREEERKQQREEFEESVRQYMEDIKLKKKEYKKQQKRRKKEFIKAAKKFKEAGLDSDQIRREAHQSFAREALARTRREAPHTLDLDNNTPKNLIMEYTTDEIAIALRLGDTDMAIELLGDKILQITQSWIIDSDKLRDWVLHHALLDFLDQDKNNILHYAVYFRDDEMVSHLVQEARRWQRLEYLVLAKNKYGLGAKDYAVLVQDETIEKHIDRLIKETETIMERKRLLPTFWRQVAKFRKAPSFMPMMLSIFGHVLGATVFESGWIVTLAVTVFAVISLTKHRSTRQYLLDDPAVLPHDMLIYHGFWLILKMCYRGVAAVIPCVSGYCLVSILLSAVAFVLIPGHYHITPICKALNLGHDVIVFWVGLISFPRSLPTDLKATLWLTTYIVLLLLAKTLTMKTWFLFCGVLDTFYGAVPGEGEEL